jgi:hypothetical protein
MGTRDWRAMGLALGLALVLGVGCQADGTTSAPQDSAGGFADGGGAAGGDATAFPPYSEVKQDSGQLYPTQLDGGGAPPALKVCMSYCTTVSDCPQGAAACQNKVCVQCQTDQQCVQNFQAKTCNTQTGMCRYCNMDSDCTMYGQPMGTGKCDSLTGFCIACSTDTECSPSPNTKRCLNGRCVQCKSDADCSSSYLKGCDTNTGYCSICKSDAECCLDKTSCSLKCTSGVCTCTTSTQCSDVIADGKWECASPF